MPPLAIHKEPYRGFPVPSRELIGKLEARAEHWKIRNIAEILTEASHLSTLMSPQQESLAKEVRKYRATDDYSALQSELRSFIKVHEYFQKNQPIFMNLVSSYLPCVDIPTMRRTNREVRKRIARFQFSGKYTRELLFDPTIRRYFSGKLDLDEHSMYCMDSEKLSKDQLTFLDNVIQLTLRFGFNEIPTSVTKKYGMVVRKATPARILKLLLHKCIGLRDHETLALIFKADHFKDISTEHLQITFTNACAASDSGALNSFETIQLFLNLERFNEFSPECLGQNMMFLAGQNKHAALRAFMETPSFDRVLDHSFGQSLINSSYNGSYDTLLLLMGSERYQSMDIEHLYSAIQHTISTNYEIDKDSREQTVCLLVQSNRFRDLGTLRHSKIIKQAAFYLFDKTLIAIMDSESFQQIDSDYLTETLNILVTRSLRDPALRILKDQRIYESDKDHLKQILLSASITYKSSEVRLSFLDDLIADERFMKELSDESITAAFELSAEYGRAESMQKLLGCSRSHCITHSNIKHACILAATAGHEDEFFLIRGLPQFNEIDLTSSTESISKVAIRGHVSILQSIFASGKFDQCDPEDLSEMIIAALTYKREDSAIAVIESSAFLRSSTKQFETCFLKALGGGFPRALDALMGHEKFNDLTPRMLSNALLHSVHSYIKEQNAEGIHILLRRITAMDLDVEILSSSIKAMSEKIKIVKDSEHRARCIGIKSALETKLQNSKQQKK